MIYVFEFYLLNKDKKNQNPANQIQWHMDLWEMSIENKIRKTWRVKLPGKRKSKRCKTLSAINNLLARGSASRANFTLFMQISICFLVNQSTYSIFLITKDHEPQKSVNSDVPSQTQVGISRVTG